MNFRIFFSSFLTNTAGNLQAMWCLLPFAPASMLQGVEIKHHVLNRLRSKKGSLAG